MKSYIDQAVEVGGQMLDLYGTRQVRKHDILTRRFQRLVGQLGTVDEIDEVLNRLRDKYPWAVAKGIL